MWKTIGIVLAAGGLLAGLLYLFGGVRVALDGSGAIPRFVSSAPDYDALEADRARWRGPADLRNGASPARGTEDAADTAAPEPAPSEAASTATAAPAPAPPADSRAPEAAAPRPRPSGAWTDFRGPRRDGRYPGPIRLNWPREGLPLLWKQPVGLGYASFVAAEGRAFTIEQRRANEVVAAYDTETGRELWTNEWAGAFVESMGGDGPRATPTYAAGRLFALGALGELRCLDVRTGAVIWRRNILADTGASNLPWGMAGAPLVTGDTVIVLPGGRNGRSVAAYHARTGAPLWTALDDQQAYVSPMIVTLAGRSQLLIVTARRAVGLAPEDGRLLWEFEWATDMGINAAQPLVVSDTRVFISAGYGQGAAVFEITRNGDAFVTRTVWRNARMKNKFTSSVLHRGYIYGLDESILACIDAATGEQKWKGGRYGYGQTLLAGDHLVVLTEDGDLALVTATPERHEEISRVPAIEGKTWNHPIVIDGRLLVRNQQQMAAFAIVP